MAPTKRPAAKAVQKFVKTKKAKATVVADNVAGNDHGADDVESEDSAAAEVARLAQTMMASVCP